MRKCTRISCNYGRIEVAKLKELLYSQNYAREFDLFIEYFHKEDIGFHKENENRVMIGYEADDEYIYWLFIDFEPDTNEKVGKHRKIKCVDIDYFDPNRDHRNG